MGDISFIHLASAGKKVSTEHIALNIRKHHPSAYYFLGSDGVEDLMQIACRYNCEYRYYTDRLGYPDGVRGYDVERLLKWLERFRTACLNTTSSHIMMTEDDVWLTKPVTVHDDWEMACHYVPYGNVIPEGVIDMIERFSGKRPLTNYYGGGGGSIYKVSTFLENYDRVTTFFKEQTTYIQDNLYPTIGWMDCYMVIYYMLCGKDYTINPYMTDTHHHQPGFDFDKFVNEQPESIEIVNNYKKYYWV